MEKLSGEKENNINSQIIKLDRNFASENFDEIIELLKKSEISKETFGNWYANKKHAKTLGYTIKVNLYNTINELKEGIPTANTVIKVMLQSIEK